MTNFESQVPEVLIDSLLELRQKLGHETIVAMRKTARELRNIGYNAFPIFLLHKISFFLNLRNANSIDIQELARKENLSERTIYRYLNEYFHNHRFVSYLAQQEQALLNKTNRSCSNNEAKQKERRQPQRDC